MLATPSSPAPPSPPTTLSASCLLTSRAQVNDGAHDGDTWGVRRGPFLQVCQPRRGSAFRPPERALSAEQVEAAGHWREPRALGAALPQQLRSGLLQLAVGISSLLLAHDLAFQDAQETGAETSWVTLSRRAGPL